jgi:pimeloyl-ACP methyl ester carboxylesterase
MPATVLTEVAIPLGSAALHGTLVRPSHATALVLFAHGSGSGRHSPRNQFVARMLHRANLATLLLDLLTPEEESADRHTGRHRFDIPLLAERLLASTIWAEGHGLTRDLKMAYFGASTGAAAALVAAARHHGICAIVSRGGRPDLAGEHLRAVSAPTLLIVGGMDRQVLQWNEEARATMACEAAIEIVPKAGHLFEEPGALACVGTLAAAWLAAHCNRSDSMPA